ncbi:NACHT domain-containing NTPase [Dyadobacter sp. CY351]|uniref:NACHT domain-containing protein n=1 Tax=Dyadobacter sp. CY351 TaxID=2909337 RepID=UPI001F3B0CDA|nr:NACHT domain-containing protein [Dyadobacter sp. CY351]MCF2516033.1 NACHT domain-containing protein [Dyadobacter sp. CY351]
MPLITTSFIAFGSWLAIKIGDKGFDIVADKLIEIDRKDKFYKVVKRTSKEIQKKYPKVLGGSIAHFFKKEEVFSELVNLLFLDANANPDVINEHFDVQTLPLGFVSEFILTLKSNLLREEDFQLILSNKEIYLTCLGISNEIKTLVEITTISKGELVEIRKILEDRFTEKFNEDDFIERYLQNAENNLSQVTLIGLGVDMEIKKGRRKKLKQIFVKPNFRISENHTKNISEEVRESLLENDDRLSCEDIFSVDRNLVVLGSPGSGKSFLIKYIICAIISKDILEFNSKSIFDALPFRIELRKYLAFKKENGGNILSYLINVLDTEYAVSSMLESVIEKIVRNKKTLFLFDGLDEIFDATDKNSVRNDIENFVRNYPETRSITSSRIEGYEEAAFDNELFSEVFIDKFDDYQIRSYLEKWYMVEEDNEITRNEEISDFISKKDGLDSELLSNPLLLSLIVILYRNNLKLPESKLEIYKSCTSTLVDKWDSSKELTIDLDLEILKRKETVFADLAFWQYCELSTDTKIRITYDRAKNIVGNSLQNKLRLVDEYTVEVSAEKFMTYASKRSIYFDNNFTHKTFLEYYTAYYIYTNIEKKHKKQERDELITRYIGNPFWHIVLELLLNLIDKDQADNEIVDDIAALQLGNGDQSLNFLLAVLPSLQNISTTLKDNIFVRTISYLIAEANPDARGLIPQDRTYPEFEKLHKMVTAGINKDILDGSLRKISAALASESERILFFTLKIELLSDILDLEVRKKYFGQAEDLVAIQDLMIKDERLFKYYIFLLGGREENSWIVNAGRYIKLFGVKQAYESSPSVFMQSLYVSIFTYIVNSLFDSDNFTSIEQNLQEVKKMGISFNELVSRIFVVNKSFYFGRKVFDSDLLNELISKGVSDEGQVLILIYILRFHKPRQNKIDFERRYGNIADERFKRVLIQSLNKTSRLRDLFSEYIIDDKLFEILGDEPNKWL